MKPYVGIMLNDKTYHGIILGRTHYEDLSLYEEACHALDLIPCYFRMQDVNLAKKQVVAYTQQFHHPMNTYQLSVLPLPQVIHNRAIHFDHSTYRVFKKWQANGIYVFNYWNRYNKWYIHQLLLREPSLHPHLPYTQKATLQNLSFSKKKYTSLIIKPNKSSIGRGIMKLDRVSKQQWRLIYPAKVSVRNHKWFSVSFHKTWPRTLQKRLLTQAYIVQQRIPLATYQGKSFDFRVSVQKGEKGTWGVTGIVTRVASKKHFLTNIGLGGKVHSTEKILSELYPQNYEHVLTHICTFALQIVNCLSQFIPHLADVGLDIGILQNGFPMFIECNGKDQRYTFLLAGEIEIFKKTYYQPMAYAKYMYLQR